jgi:hypothetical protein
MLRLLRIALLWLAALAVPVQGFAAATMLHCGPGHAGMDAAVTQMHEAPRSHADGNPRRGHAAGHHHGDEDSQAGPDTQAAVPDDTVVDSGTGKSFTRLHQLAKSKCASCASCCSAPALPATPLLLGSPALGEPVTVARPVSAAVFLTDGPERPPRSFLA